SILVVEDEPGTRQALELLLGLEGYAVGVAANGLQGLEALALGEFDLVLTDHMMPLMDGLVFLRTLREREGPTRLPVIMMSASPRPPESMLALMDAFVAKPFEIPMLLRVIERVLAGRRAE
ncbi:MAG TPA: response regulator, partial [Lysobacter sp.]